MEVFPCSYWFDNLGFTTEGKFADVLIIPSSWGFPMKLYSDLSRITMKELNRDFKLTGEKRLLDLSSLDEWRSEAYENARLFKRK